MSASDQTAAVEIGSGTKRPSRRRRGHGVLHFAVADSEKIAPEPAAQTFTTR